jgi:transposase
MRFYTHEHPFYCGIDLHARTMHLCILNQAGEVVFDRNLPTDPTAFLDAIAPYRQGILVGVECMFAWYWLADLCHQHNIAFVLGHALYMRLIHGGKGKNDRIDAAKIARLLRSGAFPLAYAYPKGMRETRDLLRRRNYLVRQRGSLLTHIQIVNSQYNLPPIGKELRYEGKRTGIAERFPEGCVRRNITVDLYLIRQLDRLIDDLESELVRTVQVEDRETFERLKTIPGVGSILGLVLLYELHDWRRFATVGQFLSYARLVRCVHESAGKKLGTGNNKIGNAHLRWAFAEAACQMLRLSDRARKWKERYQQKRGKGKAVSVLAAKLGRAVYHMLRKGEDFDERRFWNDVSGSEEPKSRKGSTRGKGTKSRKPKRVRKSVECV